MTNPPDDDEAALARKHTLAAVEVLREILRDPNTPDNARSLTEQVLITHGLITLPDGPWRPCRVH
jgi:hypothetical protein